MRGTLLVASLLVTTTAAKLIDDEFDFIVEAYLDLLHIPGLSVAIIKDGDVETKGYGFSQLGPDVPTTPDTLYFTGSTTKAFTAAAAVKIVTNDSEHVKWTTPMSRLLPGDFILSDDYASSHITLEDALSHRSGLPRHDRAYGWGITSAADVVRSMRYLDFSAEPRTRWQYNNMMFTAVGLWIEQYTSKTLEEVFQEWFWKPLGMNDTTFSIEEAAKQRDENGTSRLARGYYWTGEYYVPDAYIDILPVAGAGATISSINDYVLWAQTLLAAARMENSSFDSPITDSVYRALVDPRSIVQLNLPPDVNIPTYLVDPPLYGLGWLVQKFGKFTTVTHSGGLHGFGTDFYIVPELDLAFITMGNTAATSNYIGVILFVQLMMKIGAWDAYEAMRAEIAFGAHPAGPATPRSETAVEYDIKVDRENKDKDAAPLPGEIEDYLGLYTHPAYGTINVTFPPRNKIHSRENHQHILHPGKEKGLLLHITPSARTWPEMYVLTHSHHTFFDVGFLNVHGSHDLPSCTTKTGERGEGRNLECRDEIAYEFAGSGSAVFEMGIDGGVERLGIEMEPEMVRNAREEGEGKWRGGMVWFGKVEKEGMGGREGEE